MLKHGGQLLKSTVAVAADLGDGLDESPRRGEWRPKWKALLARLNKTLAGLRSKQQVSQQTISEYESYVNECMKHMGKARTR